MCVFDSSLVYVSLCFPVKVTTTPPLSSFVPLQGEIGRPGSKVKHPSPSRLYNPSPSLHLSLEAGDLDLPASVVPSDVISLSACSQAHYISLGSCTT